MPTYEYECKHCGHQLEAFQKMSDAALTDCPKCHQGALSKLISATSFQLKGTGWYVTDFRDKGKPKKESQDQESESGSKGTTEVSEPSKVESKTEPETKSKSNDSNSNDKATG